MPEPVLAKSRRYRGVEPGPTRRHPGELAWPNGSENPFLCLDCKTCLYFHQNEICECLRSVPAEKGKAVMGLLECLVFEAEDGFGQKLAGEVQGEEWPPARKETWP